MLRGRGSFNDKAGRRAVKMLREAGMRVKGHRITVGIEPDEADTAKLNYEGMAGKLSLMQVACMLEFGTRTMPARAFLRDWFDQRAARFKKEAAEAMRAEYRGDSEAVRAQAKEWLDDLRDWMRAGEGHFDPLAAATIKERERAGLPGEPALVATEQLLRALSAQIDGESVT